MGFLQTYDAVAALPEIILACLAMVLLLVGVFRQGDSYKLVSFAAILSFVLTAWAVMFWTVPKELAFGGAFVVDGFAQLMKLLVLFGSAIAVLLSRSYFANSKVLRFEYPVLIMLATVGMMIMISANDFMMLYVGLELQSLALYVVAAIDRDRTASAEAGLKYFVLGALSSGLLLYGISFVYGFTGSTGFNDITSILKGADKNLGLIFGLVFILAGLAFKVSAVPFHMWTPDVYEGAPTPVTAFLASAPKVAAMALLVRVMVQPFTAYIHDWQQIITFIAVASMLLGALAGIGQQNIKRLLAYSSIGNMGFALVGLAAGNKAGVEAVALYMLIYMLTVMGTFACVIAMRREGRQLTAIADFAGLARTNKGMAFILALLMFSLAGIPPLAGFFAKYAVFVAAVEAQLYTLSIIGVLCSVIGAFYYLRIIKVMYFDEPTQQVDKPAGEVMLVAYASGIFSLGYIFFAYYFVSLVQKTGIAIF